MTSFIYKYSRISTSNGKKSLYYWTYHGEQLRNAKSGPAEDAEAQGGTA